MSRTIRFQPLAPATLPLFVRLVATIATVIATPSAVRAQSRDTLSPGVRVRVEVFAGGRTLLHHPKTHTLEGKLLAATDDSLVLAMRPGTDWVRIPRSEISTTYVSLGVPNRFESAARSLFWPTMAAAVSNAISMNVRRPRDTPSISHVVVANTLSTAAVTGTLGLLFPRERWRRLRAQRASFVACNADSASHACR